MAKHKTSTPQEGFQAALAAYTAKIAPDLGRSNGAMAHLARALGVSRQNVDYWRRAGISTGFVSKVEKLTGVPRRILRPDIFGQE